MAAARKGFCALRARGGPAAVQRARNKGDQRNKAPGGQGAPVVGIVPTTPGAVCPGGERQRKGVAGGCQERSRRGSELWATALTGGGWQAQLSRSRESKSRSEYNMP
eukprot:13377716-Heterocapsa_arctica.AAC.1